MSDSIFIRGLRVQTRIGWSEEERAEPRGLTFTIELETDTAEAGTTDQLSNTVDYHRVTTEIASLVEPAETRLLERLAERVARLCLGMGGVRAVTVEVEKDDPPIEEDVQSVAVRIRREE